MSMTPQTIKQKIEAALPSAQVSVTSDDDVHFQAEVLCPSFAGLTRIKQQQAVYAVLNPDIATGEIHALQLKTGVPD